MTTNPVWCILSSGGAIVIKLIGSIIILSIPMLVVYTNQKREKTVGIGPIVIGKNYNTYTQKESLDNFDNL